METAQRLAENPEVRIRSELLRALGSHPDVPDAHLGVAVTDQLVTLSGSVGNDRERAAAVGAARNVAGVRTVIDAIVVIDRTRCDAEHQLAAAVDAELAQWLDALPNVQAIVRGGVVTLTGVVDDHLHKNSLMITIRNIAGVAWVDDRLIDRERALHDLVRKALGQRNPLEADQLRLRTTGREVWISGACSCSQAARDDVKRELRTVPGVDVVHDDVDVATHGS